MKNLYLYLGRRDKKSVRVLAVMGGGEGVHPTRILEPYKAGLSPNIVLECYENRMLWELWAEGADSYEALKRSLLNRGYSDLPFNASPVFTAKQPAGPRPHCMIRRQS